MKVFVINLDRNPDRMKFMKKQLDDLGLEFERISAVDGENLTSKELEDLYDDEKAIKNYGKSLNLGEVGCSASHFVVYKKMIDNNINKALILEDDIKINKNIIKIINKYNDKTDFVTMDYNNITLKDFKKHLSSKKSRVFDKILISIKLSISFFIEYIVANILKSLNITLILTWYRNLRNSGCYIITIEGVKKIYTYEQKIENTADCFLQQKRNEGKIKLYFSLPKIGEQQINKFGTNIQNNLN